MKIVKKIRIIFIALCIGFMTFVLHAELAQDAIPRMPGEFEKLSKDLITIQKDVAILRKEIKKVRSSVSGLSKTVKLQKGLSQAINELNLKLENQAESIKTFSGELYRLGANREHGKNKDVTRRKELEQMYKDVTNHALLIQDLKSEMRILREMQSDIQEAVPTPDISREQDVPVWKRALNWKYWGQTACGIALIALIIAL